MSFFLESKVNVSWMNDVRPPCHASAAGRLLEQRNKSYSFRPACTQLRSGVRPGRHASFHMHACMVVVVGRPWNEEMSNARMYCSHSPNKGDAWWPRPVRYWPPCLSVVATDVLVPPAGYRHVARTYGPPAPFNFKQPGYYSVQCKLTSISVL